MTPDKILRQAEEAGAAKFFPMRQTELPDNYLVGKGFLQKFHRLATNAALEEAAKAVKALDCAHRCGVGEEIAAAIRKLKEETHKREPGCDYCNNDLYAGVKCPVCGRKD